MKGRAVRATDFLAAGAVLALAIGLAACGSPKVHLVPATVQKHIHRAATSTTAKAKLPPGSTSSSSSSTSTTKGQTTCTAAELTFSSTRGQGAAGTISFSIQMKNQTSTPCTLDGYPGMQLLDGSGNDLPTDVVRGGVAAPPTSKTNTAPKAVTLGPGQSATVGVSYEDVSVNNQGVCPTSGSVEITPPNAYDHGTLPLAIAPCGGGMVHVSPVYVTS